MPDVHPCLNFGLPDARASSYHNRGVTPSSGMETVSERHSLRLSPLGERLAHGDGSEIMDPNDILEKLIGAIGARVNTGAIKKLLRI